MSDLIKELIPSLEGESEESAFTVENEEQSNETSQNNDDGDTASNSLSDVVGSNENFAEGSIPDDFHDEEFNALIALPSS